MDELKKGKVDKECSSFFLETLDSRYFSWILKERLFIL
jgi:hypothetical protein